MRNAVIAAVLGLPASAHAFGLGSTIAGFGSGEGVVGSGFRPTFDLVFDPVILQIHALDTLEAAFDDDLYLGLSVFVRVHEAEIAGPFSGVVEPGGGFDLFGDADAAAIAGQCRLGVVAEGVAGFGLYVVPAIGVVTGPGDSSPFAGGALQFSAWFSL